MYLKRYKLHSWVLWGLWSWQHGSAGVCVEFSGEGHNVKSCKGVPAVGWHASKQYTSTLKAQRIAPFFVITCYSLVTAWGEEKSAYIFHFSMSSRRISFSEQYICESKPMHWRLGKVTSGSHHNINCLYYTIICSKWFYKSSFRGQSWNPVFLSQAVSKNICLIWPEKNVCEVFKDLNTEQQQSHKLELNKFKLFFFCLFYISWNHAWSTSQHDLGHANKRLNLTNIIMSFIRYIVK